MAEYIVKAGDNATKIAKSLGLSSYKDLGGLGSNPNLIMPGQVLTYGSSAPAAASPAPATAPAGNALDPYIAASTARLNPVYDKSANDITNVANQTKSTYDTLATNTLAREPLIRETYKNLAAEFGQSQNVENTIASRMGEQNIGGARAAVAATGAENVQGAFQAPITAAQDKFKADIFSISERYGAKYKTLLAEENSTVQELVDKATEYTLTGQNQYSKALLDVSALRLQQQKDILAEATAMFGADEEVRKFNYQVEQDQKTYDLAVRKMEEDARQFAISEANQNTRAQASLNSAAEDRKLAATQKAAGAYKFTVKKDGTGIDFYDDNGIPTSPWEYFAAKGGGQIKLSDVRTTLAQSSDPQDQAIVNEINQGIARAGGLPKMSDEQILARIQNKWSFK